MTLFVGDIFVEEKISLINGVTVLFHIRTKTIMHYLLYYKMHYLPTVVYTTTNSK